MLKQNEIILLDGNIANFDGKMNTPIYKTQLTCLEFNSLFELAWNNLDVNYELTLWYYLTIQELLSNLIYFY